MTTPSIARWSPPANPDADQIYNEAAKDRRAKRYDDALAKTLWFHEHALTHAPSMKGVRVSFALNEWLNLAESYPPAMEAMKTARDRAEEKVRTGVDIAQPLQDATALNRELEDTARNVALFTWLDANHSEQARANFPLALSSLVEAHEYKMCGKYIDAGQIFDSAANLYRTMNEQGKLLPEEARQMRSFAGIRFKTEVATVVAVLSVNDRHDEAQRIADAARGVLDDADTRAALDAALKGKFPPPWPDDKMRGQMKAMRAEMRKMGL
jgi:hypothetical protein